jgi:hypothetical protein
MPSQASVATVLSGADATFHFTPPLTVMLLCVYDERGRLVWRLAADEVSSVPASEGVFVAMPSAEAPAEVIAAAQAAQREATSAQREKGSNKERLESIQYGLVPEGYREETPARQLAPGSYLVRVVARNGHADCEFNVPNA